MLEQECNRKLIDELVRELINKLIREPRILNFWWKGRSIQVRIIWNGQMELPPAGGSHTLEMTYCHCQASNIVALLGSFEGLKL